MRVTPKDLRAAIGGGALAALLAAVGCTGEVGARDSVDSDPGTATLRRLNRTEYNNTVRDLLGDTTQPANGFPSDPVGTTFDNEVEVQTIPAVLVEEYATAAAALIDTALADGNEQRAKILTCDPSGAGKDACVHEILGAFAHRAWRRPVEAAEIDRLAALVADVEGDGGDTEEGISIALQATLVDPSFLFMVELDPDPTSAKAHRLTDHELASRLSYFIYRSMPDDALLAAADDGALADPTAYQAEVDRMLADPKAASFAQDFSDQWLNTRTFLDVSPSPDVFPSFDGNLRSAMATETRLLFQSFLTDDRDYRDLVDADFTFVNARLARHYGIEGVTSADFKQVSTAGTVRSGLLGKASILTSTSTALRGSIPKRGKFILSNLLCQPPPDPPPDIPSIPDVPSEGDTARQTLENVTNADAVCMSCHIQLNPLGGGLEHFDGVGAYRELDNGQPIDATGALPDGTTFDDSIGEAAVIKANPAFTRCVTRQLFSFALGRRPQPSDTAALTAIEESVDGAGNRIRDLILTIVTDDTFTARRGASL